MLLPFDVAGARGSGHAGLDEDARIGLGDLAGAQVADGARLERRDAAEADDVTSTYEEWSAALAAAPKPEEV